MKLSRRTKDISWEELHNIAEGETCLILCNGPNLLDVPVSFWQKYDTFGLNRIFLKTDFTATCLVVSDVGLLQKNLREIIQYESKLLFTQRVGTKFKLSQNVFLDKNVWMPQEFYTDLTAGIVTEGHSVTFVALQIAFWMGYKTSLIIGMNHFYKESNTGKGRGTKQGIDTDHFSPNYLKPGEEIFHPVISEFDRFYRKAKIAYECYEREIINLSTVTNCNVFQRDDWQKYA